MCCGDFDGVKKSQQENLGQEKTLIWHKNNRYYYYNCFHNSRIPVRCCLIRKRMRGGVSRSFRAGKETILPQKT